MGSEWKRIEGGIDWQKGPEMKCDWIASGIDWQKGSEMKRNIKCDWEAADCK